MMKKDFEHWNDLSKNPKLLQHYNLLGELGIWEYHEHLKNQIKNNSKLLDIAIDIFNQQSIEELLDFVVSHLLNIIIPSTMAFVVIEEPNADTGETFIYENMKLISNDLVIHNLNDIKEFFQQYPNPIQYALFEYQLQNPEVTDQFSTISPDLMVPIVGIGGFHGIIVLGRKVLGEDYTAEELAYISRLMAFTSVSIQNNIHHRHAITDRKTKLYNHSFFLRRLDEEIARVYRNNSSLALLVIDVDHFKTFNDSHGHYAGDLALESLAEVLQSHVRKEDIPARFGGEEFVVLLVDCTQESAWCAAERIRKAIAAIKIPYKNADLSFTASFGICHVNRYLKYSSQELIERADKALYKSKKNGRNRTTIYKPGLYFKAYLSKTEAVN